ncbi:zinc-ribbon and DUF3426 domain-containing protein [Variovorax sp. J22G73]|uniref:zinc-ribbon and DUF3426 domain-containing protein n=1 Tax=unclassified Variovorax TaxID=663243 RepID=UPI0025773C9D|nr:MULTISPECIES: zinc-ribbon and DUF3426 domain-containing protein [unclassified Variovorax]MDM0010310.1 zinc-ribbon and DUF3426 domain-containing protein [Variovorax sp. J22R203]MDM0102646.1 zinc-ribbon and DUF3426 domain-containing protein [Variovorax sp. J22G73]
MSLVTRCPACTTTFKVVRDQLRISDGWVRCGRCSHVFDATLDLHEAPDGASPPTQGGYMPGLVGAAAEPKVQVQVQPQPPSAPEAASPPPPPSSPPVASPSEPERPQPQSEDADFFDEEPEPSLADAPLETRTPERTEPADADAAAPAAPEALPAFSLTLPDHGIAADEPWSDLDVSEPAWRPPPSTLPPFPNIDLNLASPPPAARPSPPPPPLPFTPRVLKTRALIERASDEGEGEREQEEKDHDQVQMQKALRRSRAKSAKIAGAKAREERAAAKAAEASVVQVASEPDYSLSAAFEPPLGHPFADEEEVAQPSSPGFWQRRSVRAVLIVLAVLAVLLLVLQVLRHERDGIAARQPNLRPALAALCQYTGCELAALRQIGDIVIEGAAFAREKSGANDYRLSFTLRNGAAVPLAMPAVELSLLDTQERAVVRRVLTPADYGAPAVLQARADRAASLPLSLSASEAAALPPIAGYRVEAFYP